MKYAIGLDLGINNVGWSIYDMDQHLIEKCGVRLFAASDDAKLRRVTRNSRRRRKRKENRVSDVLELFHHIHFPNQITIDEHLIKTRVFAVKEKVSKQDIVNIVVYFMKHRGYIPYGDGEEGGRISLNGTLPCDFYYELYLGTGRYHGADLPSVRLEDNERELLAMFQEQKKYYPELSEIEDSVFQIFKRKRAFWEGPGSEKSFSPYGRFKNQDDVLEYVRKKKENSGFEKYIFEDFIGKCSIYVGEKCVPKANFYAEVFNLLNDFINVNIIDVEGLDKEDSFVFRNGMYKFSEKGLQDIIDYLRSHDTVQVKTLIKKLFGLEMTQLEGYRMNKNHHPIFSTLDTYRMIKKNLTHHECPLEWMENIELYNRIIYHMAIAPGTVEFEKMICGDQWIQQQYSFSSTEIEVLKEIFVKLKKSGVLSYHSLSEKALIRSIGDMMSTQMNFMQVRKKFDYDKEAREYFIKNYHSPNGSGVYQISSQYVDDIIASPQVKKTLRQAIKVINGIIREKKQLPEVIAIESAKEMNGEEKRKEIESEQRQHEKLANEARNTIIEFFGEEKLSQKNIDNVILYHEINGVCPYCGKTKIKLDDVLHDKIEVDHILPISKSSNDSFDNKTIVCPNCNQVKKNRTPFEYLSSLGEYEAFKERISGLSNMSQKKKDNLLFEGTIDKYKIRFFHRNLSDTAYATKELVHQIQLFNYYLKQFCSNEQVLTLSTPGQLTHKIREHLSIPKDRDVGKYHHAVDASIVASIANTEIGKVIIESQNNPKFWIDNKEKAFISVPKLLEHFHLGNMMKQFNSIDSDDKISLSSQVSKNPQKQLFNANLYKLIKKDDQFYKIEQIDNIYELDIRKDRALLDSLFDENDSQYTLLCYNNNRNLFYKLKEIYDKYKDKIQKGNPFVDYIMDKEGLEDGFDLLSHIEQYGIKVSKHSRSPIVKRLRYYGKISTPFLLEKETIHKKENTYLAFDSLKLTGTEVYVDLENNKFIFLPIYSVSMDLKNKSINKQEKYYQTLYQKYIGTKKVRYVDTLYNGMMILVQKKNGKTVFGEYQTFHKTNNLIELKSGDNFTTNDLAFTIYDVDILGNKKIRLTERLK